MEVKLVDGIIKVSGKIDTLTAGDFETQSEKLIKETDVIFDFDEVTYISSVGLRKLLKFSRDNHNITIKNANAQICEIMRDSGFTEFINVIEKIKEISVEGKEIIGVGATGAVYQYDNETIVKVFNEGTPFEAADEERKRSRTSFVNGIPTEIPFALVNVDGCPGVMYELMDGMTLGKAFVKYPEKYDELLADYIEFVKNISEIEMEPGALEYKKDSLKEYFKVSAQYLPKEDVELLDELLELVPKGNTFVHGDPHPGNLMLHNDELLLIDMADVAIGPNYYDVVQVYSDTYYSAKNPQMKEAIERTIGMPIDLISKVGDDFIKGYFQDASDSEREEIIKKLDMINAVFVIPRLSVLPKEMLEPYMPVLKANLIDSIIRPNLDEVKRLLVEGL